MPVSPIDERHRALGAKLTDFGGWQMPLSYPGGTLEEHRRCRTDAVVFDVSHLGSLRVSGAHAFDRLQQVFTNDLARIGPGRAQYTHLLDPADGSVVDDIIVWWVHPERFDVMPNASNTDGVADALGSPDASWSVRDVTTERAVFAIQGPQARARLSNVFPDAAAVARFHVADLHWRGVGAVVAGTGYTGEDGVEIAVDLDGAASLWDALVEVGVAPAGLGARDTLRLEAGLPLHGHELGPGITPLQAGLGWVVRWDKGDFTGRSALEAERERGVSRRLRGIVVDGRRPPRAGQTVLVDGLDVGEVTSGNFSPSLGCGIAMALLAPDLADGAQVTIDARGSFLRGCIVPMPFVA